MPNCLMKLNNNNNYCARRFDVVLMDLFNGSNPECSTRSTVLTRLRNTFLSPDGLLIVNIFGHHSSGPNGETKGPFSLLVSALECVHCLSFLNLHRVVVILKFEKGCC